ncbi:MAG TPA: hypothetical protein VMW50_10725 [Dehalococcoidia bacterium]|nr:hypothetical protein [Dehalococcoidia bacterium]
MNRFSQRHGFEPVKDTIQLNDMDDALRTGLWNALTIVFWPEAPNYNRVKSHNQLYALFAELWVDYFKKPLDTLPYEWSRALKEVREYFFKYPWYCVYNFVEFAAENYPNESQTKMFVSYCNDILKRELSGYRFIGKKIVPITSEEEITEIEEALKPTETLRPVAIHLETALDFLSDRESPDYRNSIKESISAVESTCRLIAGDDKAKLNQALRVIKDKIGLHRALEKAFDSLYGYTSDEDGIRHALLDEPDLDFEDARFMLVSCAAFINYLKSKSSKAGIKL